MSYETDFYKWTNEQARLLKAGKFDQIDIENIVEELETLGRGEKRELVNRLAVLLAHLLKWQLQPERRGKSWRATIEEQRRQLKKHLKEDPSLKPFLNEAIEDAHLSAIAELVRVTPFEKKDLPDSCPYSIEQIFDDEYLPDGDIKW